MDARERCCNVWGEVLQRIGCCNKRSGRCCNQRERLVQRMDGRKLLQQCNGWAGGVATNGWESVAQSGRCCNGWSEGVASSATERARGVATNSWGSVARSGRCCNRWAESVATMQRCCNRWAEGVATLQRCCNKWESECNGRGGVATNRRGEMGKMQQDVAIFHGGWTTVNDATAIYGSYRESCNKVPCTLHPTQIIAQLQGRPDVMMSNASHVHKQITMVEAHEAELNVRVDRICIAQVSNSV